MAHSGGRDNPTALAEVPARPITVLSVTAFWAAADAAQRLPRPPAMSMDRRSRVPSVSPAVLLQPMLRWLRRRMLRWPRRQWCARCGWAQHCQTGLPAVFRERQHFQLRGRLAVLARRLLPGALVRGVVSRAVRLAVLLAVPGPRPFPAVRPEPQRPLGWRVH